MEKNVKNGVSKHPRAITIVLKKTQAKALVIIIFAEILMEGKPFGATLKMDLLDGIGVTLYLVRFLDKCFEKWHVALKTIVKTNVFITLTKSQRKSHYDYRDNFALEKFEKVQILVYHICPKNG